MKQRRFLIGPGAPSLRLVVVVVGMSVLGLLALMSAKNDARLAERTVRYTRMQYGAMAQAERSLAELDAALTAAAASAADESSYMMGLADFLPEGMTLDGDSVAWQVDMPEGGALSCRVKIAPMGSFPRCSWQEHIFVPGGEGFDGFDDEFFE